MLGQPSIYLSTMQPIPNYQYQPYVPQQPMYYQQGYVQQPMYGQQPQIYGQQPQNMYGQNGTYQPPRYY